MNTIKQNLKSILCLLIFLCSLSQVIAQPPSITIDCGKTYHLNTKDDGYNNWHNYDFCGNSYTGYHGYNVWHKIDYSGTGDIFVEIFDKDRKGLDYFLMYVENNNDECIKAQNRSGSDNQYWSYTIKNVKSNRTYWVMIDAKSSGAYGDYWIKATCGGDNNYDYCDDYKDAKCGVKYAGNTQNGTDKYHDYSCFKSGLTGFNAREVVYRFTGRPNTTHDIELEFFDQDDIGMDLFVIENCGENNFKCHAYYERSSSDPQQFVWTIKDCLPHKEYYLILDAKNSNGRYAFTPNCYKQNYLCDDYKDLPCGGSREGHTNDGKEKYDDYSCFKSHLTGFHAKEKVYKLTNTPSSNYDLEIYFEDKHDRGLDLFLVENCGKEDYQCYRYYERNSSNPKKETFTWYNLDYRKDYYIIIDAKNVTGGYLIRPTCKPKGYFCDNYKDISCGERKYGHTKNGHKNYDDYSCFDNHLTGFHARELVYKIQDRPDYVHDIYLEFEDIFDKGLDIFIVENCGKENYKCFAYKERSSNDPKKDKFTIYNTDPDKEYYIIIDAKNVESDFYLNVRCEDNTRCYDACFNYVKNTDGSYDFYWPDSEHNRLDYDYWQFTYESSGETETKSGGNLFGYKFKHGKGLYKAAIYDSKGKLICYYYIDYDDCDGGYPMAKAFTWSEQNCPGNSCKFTLDGSASMGDDLYYHWYLTYGESSRNKHYTSQNSSMSVDVEHRDDLIAICLVVINKCGMSSFCLQGSCFNAYPDYSINATSDRDVEINFSEWNVGCDHDGRKVYIDWGNGVTEDYDYSNSLNPKYTYNKPGNYLVCVRFYYECSGSNYNGGCTLCICKTISLGCMEDIRNEDCSYLIYEEGNYVDGKWDYNISHQDGPNGYTFSEYAITDTESGETLTSQTGDYSLLPGRTYLFCVVYVDNQGCYYYCCKEVEVFYPSAVNYHLPSLACGGNGSIASIPVTVNAFTDITGFQFKIKVEDADVAQILDEIEDLNEDLNISTTDVIVSEAQNLITVAWTTDLNNEAQSLDDGSTLFVFKVMFTGETGDSTEMYFNDVLAFNNLTNQQIDVTFDDGKLCVEESFSISGFLVREDGSTLPNTTVNLTGVRNESQKTDVNGMYQFSGLIQGDYTVSPSKSQDYHDGVNIIDVGLIRIYNRSLDEDKSLNPYQQLAANTRTVLDGGLITVADETALKRMNTFDIDEFNDYSNSWVFVPESFEFSDPNKAFLDDHPTSIVFEGLSESMTAQNFVSIKIGDINTDLNLAGPRSQQSVNMKFDDGNASSGDSVTINLNVQGFENIQNLQFTISWDPEIMTYINWIETIEILGLESSSFSTRFIEEGKLTFAHSVAPGAINLEDSTLFALRFMMIGEDGASTNLSLSGDPVEILITDNTFTPVEVTTEDAEISVGETSTSTDLIEDDYLVVKSNRPNPFSEATIIPIELKQSGEVILNVYSHTGKLILNQKKFMHAGDHQFMVRGYDLHNPGIYYYEIITDRGYATRAMLYTK